MGQASTSPVFLGMELEESNNEHTSDNKLLDGSPLISRKMSTTNACFDFSSSSTPVVKWPLPNQTNYPKPGYLSERFRGEMSNFSSLSIWNPLLKNKGEDLVLTGLGSYKLPEGSNTVEKNLLRRHGRCFCWETTPQHQCISLGALKGVSSRIKKTSQQISPG